MWLLLKHQHQQENKIFSWAVIRIFEFLNVNTIRIIRIGNRTHSSQTLLMCLWKKYHSKFVFFERFRKGKRKRKQKEQEQRNEIITCSQLEPIASESKYFSWSKFRDLYLRRPEILQRYGSFKYCKIFFFTSGNVLLFIWWITVLKLEWFSILSYVIIASSNEGHSCQHLGAIEIETVHDRISKEKRAKKRKPFFRWTEEERYIVENYASQNGTAAAVRHYQ